LHDLALEVAEFGQAVVHVASLRSVVGSACNATERRIHGGGMQWRSDP